MQYKSLKDARLAMQSQGHELQESTQFPIHFKDGTIYMQPEKMDYSGGYPVLNAEKYISQHHPDKLAEYQQARAIRESRLNEIDQFLGGEKTRYPFRK